MTVIAELRPVAGQGSARPSGAFVEHAAVTVTADDVVVVDRNGRSTRIGRDTDRWPALVASTARTPSGREPRLLDLELVDGDGRTVVHMPLAFDLGEVMRFARDAGLAYRAIEGRPPEPRPDCIYLDGRPAGVLVRRAAVIVAGVAGAVLAGLLTSSPWLAAGIALVVLIGGFWWSR
jgi:hypothetical protein